MPGPDPELIGDEAIAVVSAVTASGRLGGIFGSAEITRAEGLAARARANTFGPATVGHPG